MARAEFCPVCGEWKCEGWEQHNRRYQEEALGVYGPEEYNPADFVWSEEPPEDDLTCRECYRWKRSDFGYYGMQWVRVCHWGCDHEHHRTEPRSTLPAVGSSEGA